MSNVPGARVVGADKVKAYQDAAVENEASILPGPRALGQKGKGKAVAASKPAAAYPIDEVRKVLTKTPSAVDRILEAEFARAEGPRKAALQACRVAEFARAEKAKAEVRQDVIDRIDVALGKRPKAEAPKAPEPGEEGGPALASDPGDPSATMPPPNAPDGAPSGD